MDIREIVIKHIDNFVLENKEQILKFKPIKNTDGSTPVSSSDYLPHYWDYEKEGNQNPLNSPITEKLTNQVLELIFGNKEERDVIKFELLGHIKNIEGKSWKEVEEFELKEGGYRKFSYDNLVNTLKIDIFTTMIETSFFKNEYDLRLYELRRNTLTNLFSSSHCENCGKDIAIYFDFNEKKFKSNKYSKECPKFNPLMKFNLKVPSRKLVILNDIREAFVVNREDRYSPSINCIHGVIRECEEYLKYNMAYICLSSGGINVLQNDNDKLVVMDFDQETYYQKDEKTKGYKIKEGFREIGDVSLELWAVFIMDADHYKKLCKEKGFELDYFEPVYAEISNDFIEVKYDIDKLIVEMKY